MTQRMTPNIRTLPQNFGPLKGANGNARIVGPSGDTMEFWITVKESIIIATSFTTDGCEESIESGSSVARMVLGLPEEDVRQIEKEEVIKCMSNISEEFIHCITLALDALRSAIHNYRENNDVQEVCHDGDHIEHSEMDSENESMVHGATHKLVVLSGKGGVGKSTVAVNLAVGLASKGMKVGLLDLDFHGPSVPVMLGLQGKKLQAGDGEGRIRPVEIDNLRVMSVGFLLKNGDDPIIWRGPMKMGVINQFVKDVEWGDLDYLIVDCPPGTGDEPLSICQLLDSPKGAIVVTTPQEVAASDVRKSVAFCQQVQMPIVGLIENMSGFVCPSCGENTPIFKGEAGIEIARKFDLPFWGKLPISQEVGISGDEGTSFVHRFENSDIAKSFKLIIDKALDFSGAKL